MKASSLFLSLAMIASTSAHASSMDEVCSTPDQHVKIETGFNGYGLTLTSYEYTDSGAKKTPVQMSIHDVNIEYSTEKALHEEKKGGCQPGQQTGFASWTSVKYVKAEITKRDGTAFDDGILGVSPDKKKIEAHLICERFISNIIPCDLK